MKIFSRFSSVGKQTDGASPPCLGNAWRVGLSFSFSDLSLVGSTFAKPSELANLSAAATGNGTKSQDVIAKSPYASLTLEVKEARSSSGMVKITSIPLSKKLTRLSDGTLVTSSLTMALKIGETVSGFSDFRMGYVASLASINAASRGGATAFAAWGVIGPTNVKVHRTAAAATCFACETTSLRMPEFCWCGVTNVGWIRRAAAAETSAE
mmetsp:Transcript_15865/g.18771  ORF Transcript_15865/g.18771 Transcript_15865/m.18771 type:complete len:210 (+) Transcript_15865:409-1038(+)